MNSSTKNTQEKKAIQSFEPIKYHEDRTGRQKKSI
jgi:hypothetical protein